MLEWTYNSNSIEGNTLTLHETKMVIEEGFTIKGKSLREHFEAINHQEAIEFVESLISDKQNLNKTDIMRVHYLVLQKLKKILLECSELLVLEFLVLILLHQMLFKVDELVTELIDWVNSSDINIIKSWQFFITDLFGFIRFLMEMVERCTFDFQSFIDERRFSSCNYPQK